MLRKRRVGMRALDVEVEGFQASDPPWHYERIVLHYRVTVDGVSSGVLERVIRLSVVRYCSVIATLRGVARVEATLELVGADGTTSGRQAVRLDVAVAEPLDDEPAALAPPTADEE